MTTSEKLQSLLTASVSCAVYADFHYGKGETYITHEIVSERDSAYADNLPHEQIDTMRVHIFTKNNPVEIKQLVKKLLRNNDFTISYTEQLREGDTGYSHVIIQCQTLGELD